jgi:hypothetical protein
MLLDILAGAGNLPAFTNRQSVAGEKGRLPDWKSALARTSAASGSSSIFTLRFVFFLNAFVSIMLKPHELVDSS